MSNKTSTTITLSNTTSMVSITAAALAALGLGTLIYTRSQNKKQERKAMEAMRLTQRRRKRKQQEDADAKKLPQKVTLYFDKNDEMLDEETVLKDKHNYYHKYHAVTVDFGCDDEVAGRGLITKDIFQGQQKTENAQIFIENYEKSKQNHQKQMQDLEIGESFDSEESKDSKIEIKGNLQDSVILDVNPSNFEKPKDHLFFDFFSIYAKNFIGDKQQQQNQSSYNNSNQSGLILLKSYAKEQNNNSKNN